MDTAFHVLFWLVAAAAAAAGVKAADWSAHRKRKRRERTQPESFVETLAIIEVEREFMLARVGLVRAEVGELHRKLCEMTDRLNNIEQREALKGDPHQ